MRRRGMAQRFGKGLSVLGLSTLGMALGAPALADEQPTNTSEKITITATRQEQSVLDVPATVSVITAEEIEDQLATDIKDLIRFEPGVSVRQSPSRFTAALSTAGRDGNSGFNIRGLEGNRVLIQVDGIRSPDAFSFGAQSVGRGDYVDLDILKSVEILRGPASALYGSDGLAGAVSFITKDPEDYLKGDRNFGVRARVGYASADESLTEGLSGAFRAGPWSALLAYTRRDASEQDNQGVNNTASANRTTPVPQDIQSNAWLGKIVFTPSDAHRLRFTWDHLDRDVDSNVLSAVSAATASLLAQDETQRDRYSLDYRYKGDGVIDGAQGAIYYQNATTRQYSAEDRTVLADRIRDNTFDNEVWGFSGQLESNFEFAGVANRVVFGGDYSQTRQEGIRTGTVPPVGETYPTRSFPNTDYTLSGLFLQNTFGFLDGALEITPSLRYDSYKLDPERDALYTGLLASQEDDAFSPKLGATFWAGNFGLFASYAEGFKAPSPSQVNNGFSNPVQFYTAIPNPNLKPETSETFEFGARIRNLDVLGGAFTASAATFRGDYENFIEQIQVGGNFTALNPAIYQFVNLSSVEINGAELRTELSWESGLGVIVAASRTDGDQRVNGVESPLLSVDPIKIVGGVSYRDPGGRFGGQLSYTHSDRKAYADVGSTTQWRPAAFGVVDLTAYWSPVEFLTIRAGGFNLLDEDYAWWSDVRGISPTSAVRDAYTQPGRNFSVSLTARY